MEVGGLRIVWCWRSWTSPRHEMGIAHVEADPEGSWNKQDDAAFSNKLLLLRPGHLALTMEKAS
jgi:hypothetical protein